MEKIPFSSLKFEILNESHDVNSFKCGDRTLDNFLKERALSDQKARWSTTYVVVYNNIIVAYFTILNDTVSLNKKLDNCIDEHFRELFKLRRKPYTTIPAKKLGRISVIKEFKRREIGKNILRKICRIVTPPIPTGGAVFLTADAYKKSFEFYNKLNFVKFNVKTKTKEIPMYIHFDDLVEQLFPEDGTY